MATENPAFASGADAPSSEPAVDVEAALKDGTLTAEQAVVVQERQLRAWPGTLGILTATEVKLLVATLHRVCDVEEQLFQLIQQSKRHASQSKPPSCLAHCHCLVAASTTSR